MPACLQIVQKTGSKEIKLYFLNSNRHVLVEIVWIHLLLKLILMLELLFDLK